MKKKVLWNTGFVCGCVGLLVMIASCSMFTNSLGKNSVRDQSEMLANASVSDLADLAGSTQSTNPETAKAIMEALAKDKEALKNLNVEQKENILNLALDTTLPMDKITEIAPLLEGETGEMTITEARAEELVIDIFKDNATLPTGLTKDQAGKLVTKIFSKANSTTVTEKRAKELVTEIEDSAITAEMATDLITQIFSTAATNDAKKLVEQIFDSVNAFDTTALNAILEDPKTLEEADPSVLANAAIASIAQVAKNIGIDEIMGTGENMTPPNVNFETQTPAEIVGELLTNARAAGGTVSPEDEAALTAAVTVAKLLTTGEVKPVGGGDPIIRDDAKDAKILGLVSLSEILAVFSTP